MIVHFSIVLFLPIDKIINICYAVSGGFPSASLFKQFADQLDKHLDKVEDRGSKNDLLC